VVWLGLLALESWMGSFDGGMNWIGLGWGFATNLVIAAITFALALKEMVPAAETERYCEIAIEEAAEEPEAAAV